MKLEVERLEIYDKKSIIDQVLLSLYLYFYHFYKGLLLKNYCEIENLIQ